MTSDLEAELDGLYSLPLAEFVGARNEVAKRLRASGDRDAAKQIKALAKPSLSAWAVNQLAFRHADELASLHQAGARVRTAHLATPAEQQAAGKERRAAISTLLGLVGTLFEETGQSFSRLHRQRVSLTLETLSSQSADGDRPAAGRLSRDLESQGFDALADLAAALGEAQKERNVVAPTPIPTSAPKTPTLKLVPQIEDSPDIPDVKPQDDERQRAERQKLDRLLAVQRQELEDLETRHAEHQLAVERAAAELRQAESTEAALTEAVREAEKLLVEATQRADTATAATRQARAAAGADRAVLDTVAAKRDLALRDLRGLEEERRALDES